MNRLFKRLGGRVPYPHKAHKETRTRYLITHTHRKASLSFSQPQRKQGSSSLRGGQRWGRTGFTRLRDVDYWNHTDSESTERQTLPPSSPPWHHPPANTSTKSISSAFHWDLRTWIRVLSLFEKWRFTARWRGEVCERTLQDHCKHISVSSLWQQAHVFLINRIYVKKKRCM